METTDTSAAPAASTSQSSAATNFEGRYGTYLYQGTNPGGPNYIVERASPAMLCLLRKVAPKPYTPLPSTVICHSAEPQDYSIRQNPRLSRQAVTDFYSVCSGHYGVYCENPRAIDLITLGAFAAGGKGLAYRQQLQQQQMQLHQRGGGGGGGGTEKKSEEISGVGGGGSSHSVGGMCTSSSVGSHPAKQTAAEELAYGSPLCHYYNTRVGCHRGQHCEFLHVDKNGAIVNGSGSVASATASAATQVTALAHQVPLL